MQPRKENMTSEKMRNVTAKGPRSKERFETNVCTRRRKIQEDLGTFIEDEPCDIKRRRKNNKKISLKPKFISSQMSPRDNSP